MFEHYIYFPSHVDSITPKMLEFPINYQCTLPYRSLPCRTSPDPLSPAPYPGWVRQEVPYLWDLVSAGEFALSNGFRYVFFLYILVDVYVE
jgi:hypothetical protein